MITIKPFQGLRPRADLVAQVASKPYDVLNSAEAKAEAEGNPHSFLHISKPEINFDTPVDPYSDAVYEKGKEKFEEFMAQGWLVRDETPCLYIYEQTMDGRTQTGLVAGSWIDDYFEDRIKKHELTLVAKENDRIRHMKTKMAQPGMVFLTYRPVDEIDAIIEHYTENHEPANDFTDNQDVRHRLWKIDNPNIIAKLCELFHEEVRYSYIADGHHRSAAAAKVGQQLREENPDHTGNEAYNFFLSCLFPSDQLQILDYNRLVKDLNGHSVNELLSQLQEHFTVEASEAAYKPADLHEFSMYAGGHWYKLIAKGHTYDPKDPIGVLDVTILATGGRGQQEHSSGSKVRGDQILVIALRVLVHVLLRRPGRDGPRDEGGHCR